MRHKLILATGVLATAGAVTLGTAGAASAKSGFYLKADRQTVHRHGTVGFRLEAVSDSAGEHLTNVRFCLQRPAGKPGTYKTLACTTRSHWDRKAKAEVYNINYRFGSQPKGSSTFRGTYQLKENRHWGRAHRTNAVVIHVK
ncbi:hypothetical protein DZF91_12285 [Actinomadura logoneensis]|uniref:Uncharacterized protein n=1 Tax=Actinomadura logoneensis TaxID=2293572 RepID=A0A372JMU9_9ACTN|nr:hypothetical protein [Actinomadura logoneensis]RFU41351.1 hypothetical protein DZF91_12285 [Actinomadura logoneensis]